MSDMLETDEEHGRLLGVIDMGSNSFRLVVYRHEPGRWFRLVDEIREPVRLSEGVRDGRIGAAALARGARAAHLYAAYCASAGVERIDAVATSAVRDAVNQAEVVRALSAEGRLPVRVLSEEQEARYGFLGAVNATTVTEGWFLDIGGGSLQVGRVENRRLVRSVSRPLGAVRLTEAFLSGDQRSRPEMKALRRHVCAVLSEVGWIGDGDGRLVGVGGAIRTMAVMHQRITRHPFIDPQGYRLSRPDMQRLLDEITALPASNRTRLPGLKADRADIILAAALAVDEVLGLTGARRMEVCAHGLREGVMYEHHLGGAEPLIGDVRRTAVMNAAQRFGYMRRHSDHVAHLAMAAFDGTARLGLHPGDPTERELIWAAAILHDVGVLVDYSSHQRHSEYLVLNAGLPGFDHREVAIIASLVRGHRKGPPTLAGMERVTREGDAELVRRGGAVLRLAEQIDRSRTEDVSDLVCRLTDDGALEIGLVCDGDPTLALWSGEREADMVERAFGRPLRLVAAGAPAR